MLTQLARYLPAAEVNKVAATAQQVVEITMLTAPENLPLTSSRIGSIGYWPEDRDYPKNAKGQPLALLAQFNLAELPHLADWPEQGLLAFYIDPFSDLYGLDNENLEDRSGYRTLYFPDTRTPSLTREAQRALLPANAFHEDHETVADDAFQSRWANDPQGEIRTLVEHRETIIRGIDDARLTKAWKRERGALLKNLEKIIASINQAGPPNDAIQLDEYLLSSQCQNTEKRIVELGNTHPRALLWLLDDADPSQTNELRQDIAQVMSGLNLIMDPHRQDNPNISKGWQKTTQLIQKIFGLDLNSLTGGNDQEVRTAQNTLQAFINDNDQQITALNDALLTDAWHSERDWLLSKIPEIKNQFGVTSLLATHVSASDKLLMTLLKKPNPIKTQYVQKLLAIDGEMETRPSAEQSSTWSPPISGEYAVSGHLKTHYLLRDSFEFEQHYQANLIEWMERLKLKDKTINAIDEILNQHQSTSHLGGYPFFTQNDPRYHEEKLQDAVLLFQLDSEGHAEGVDILWGDAGVGAFFISRQALQARQFDQAWFHWDCC